MARKKAKSKKSEEERGISRMLAGTVILGVVFSAGLITGQRMLRAEARAPMVSLSSVRTAPEAGADDAKTADESSKNSLRTTFSFYDHLTQDAVAQAPPAVAAEKPADADKPAEQKPAKQKSADEKPAPAAEEKPASEPKPADKPAEQAPADKPAVGKPAPEPQAKPTEPAKVLANLADAIAPEKPAEALPARYTLQVSSHPDRSSAENELSRLNKMGVEPHIVVVNVPGRGELWRVRVGKFHSMDEARDFQGSLKSRRGVAGFVTPL